MAPNWLVETLDKSQARFDLLPKWLQEVALREDTQRKAEAQKIYVDSQGDLW